MADHPTSEDTLLRDQDKKPPALLTDSARAVFRELVRTGPATRPQIGQILGLSRPTMSVAIAELEELAYVDVSREVQGPLGRKALEYRVGVAAGHVISVDAGSTHIQTRVSTLDRRLLMSQTYRLASSQHVLNDYISQAVAEQVQSVLAAAHADWGPLRALGIAVPARVAETPEDSGRTEQDVIFSRFAPPDGVEIVLENNVNCAAVAEQLYGAAVGHSTFAYVQIGLKIGMGLMLSDRLVRGRNGAAGEIGHLAFPWAPGIRPVPGEVERYIGAEALVGRVRAKWPSGGDVPAPSDADALLALAEAGNPTAVEELRRHAEDIGALVASVVSIVDPGLVVLGGGVGASPLLPPIVSRVANQLSYPVEVCRTGLGRDATVLGIERLTIAAAIPRIIGQS